MREGKKTSWYPLFRQSLDISPLNKTAQTLPMIANQSETKTEN